MSVKTLSNIIENLCVIYEKLNSLADEKTRVLKENDISKLNSIMQQEEVCNKKIMQLLEERDNFFENNNPLGVSEKQEIEKTFGKLKVISDEFAKKNEINQSLVYESLHYVNMNINMLAPTEDSDTYSPKNKKQLRKPNRVFIDSRV